jgi:hypothetical protein
MAGFVSAAQGAEHGVLLVLDNIERDLRTLSTRHDYKAVESLLMRTQQELAVLWRTYVASGRTNPRHALVYAALCAADDRLDGAWRALVAMGDVARAQRRLMEALPVVRQACHEVNRQCGAVSA